MKNLNEQANLRRALNKLLSTDVSSEYLAHQLELLGFDKTNEMALVYALFQKAIKGDMKAFDQIVKLMQATE